MKTLVIHPKDPSTGFLEIVYRNVPDKKVITGRVRKKDLIDLMESHDRVLIMGHGCPYGLFSVGQFDHGISLILDYTNLEPLRKKNNTVFIWCNADQFVNNHNLKGFYSGMFISEIGEASYCGIPGTDKEIIDESNLGFCNIISKYINETPNTIYENVTKEYGVIAEQNPVAYYNNKRLYLNS
jgi:hypothetical protein